MLNVATFLETVNSFSPFQCGSCLHHIRWYCTSMRTCMRKMTWPVCARMIHAVKLLGLRDRK